ncbi:hypothetical protein CDD81_1625 [Ophiocordyceps australis]|uniref:RNA helicase n=1 Tax=Ophiocordyceps australis TaxID=1399860 RepID=A0A2C5Y0J4_9HYPO|nr:hypothetical protein CDD81_1625 [Ophiocordyceps australis]
MAKYKPRVRKHKVLARQKASGQHEVEDSNQEILPARSKELQENKARMKDELCQQGVKVSGKKAKRLEKYMDKKLRMEENRQLLAKLAAHKMDTSLLVSSSKLGQGRETKKQAQARIAKEDQVGSGLKRPLEVDDQGRPAMAKRQKRGGVKSTVHLERLEAEDSESDEWNGFASSDQENDDSSREDSEDAHELLSQDEDVSSNDSSQESDHVSDEESTSDDDEQAGEVEDKPPSGFKAWAMQQRNEALGHQPSTVIASALEIPKPQNFTPRPPEQDALPLELQPTEKTDRKAYSVVVQRQPEIQEARLKLPVVAEEQRLMEAIHNNDVVIICGSTGSGKTTQVPQFLFEAGYGASGSPTSGMVGITQPRRVAAVSMSRRVAQELGDYSHTVAYQIRFEGSVDSKTKMKFMTDGVLLREVAQDFPLSKYSAIIIDEAHERSINTDILIGMLSRISKFRAEQSRENPSVQPLKLIIMSATLMIQDFTMNTKLFPSPPPVLHVEGRQHPVVVHFSRRTNHDYVDEAFRKISRGHRKLPPGGILVFLTGRDEILRLSKQLKSAFGGVSSCQEPRVQISARDVPMETEDIEFGDSGTRDWTDADDCSDEEGEDQDEEFKVCDEGEQVVSLKMQILPLYSLLPTREQQKVFQPPPDGHRQVILATNVAETSLTIPGIRFVIDCGRVKERKYDRVSQVQSYGIGWISKASADQRAGRAGRTGAGHCYRLYSSAVFERDFAAFAEPEIARMPIEGVALQLKAMRLPRIVNFPFPTPPHRESLAKAEKLLALLSATSPEGKITEIGKAMSLLPLSPRFARILLVGHLHDCLPYTIAMVAGLSVAEMLVPENVAVPSLASNKNDDSWTNADVVAEDRQANVRRLFRAVHENFCSLDDRSDAIKVLQVVGEFAHDASEKWCQDHFVRFKVLQEIQQLRRQLTHLMRDNLAAFASLTYQEKLDAPSEKQVKALKQMVAVGFIDRIAIRADQAPNPPEQYKRPSRAIDVPYMPLVPTQTGAGQGADSQSRLVYIHPLSALARLSTDECPQYIVYSHLQRASAAPSGSEGQKQPKTRMHALTDVSGSQLAALAKGTPLISYGKPIKEVKSSVINGVVTRECWVVPYVRAESSAGSQGWPLPARKVRQRKIAGKGWVVE